MTTHTADKLTAAKGRMGAFAKAAPALMEGFVKVSRQATAAGRFSAAQKELIATAIAVAKGCEDCIVYHAAAAKKHGASREELAEMLAVAVEMSGGPGAVYAAKAVQIFDELP
jgi:AhpD family alkylhydroperoxidase